LTFADDVLYRIELSAKFSEKEFNSCFQQYQHISALLDKSFLKLKTKIEWTSKNEKIGEGYDYTFSSNLKEMQKNNSILGVKMNRITISYEFEENPGFNDASYYILTYSQINLFLTKLDGRGY
jgi:hypothetical protein